jgi:hypothetical protein
MRAIPPQEKVFAYYYASLFVFSIALSQLRSADVVVFLQLFLKGLFCLLGLNSEKKWHRLSNFGYTKSDDAGH